MNANFYNTFMVELIWEGTFYPSGNQNEYSYLIVPELAYYHECVIVLYCDNKKIQKRMTRVVSDDNYLFYVNNDYNISGMIGVDWSSNNSIAINWMHYKGWNPNGSVLINKVFGVNKHRVN